MLMLMVLVLLCRFTVGGFGSGAAWIGRLQLGEGQLETVRHRTEQFA
jgi:hypothetical protein